MGEKGKGGSEKGRVKEKDEKGWVLVVPKGRTSHRRRRENNKASEGYGHDR